MQRLSRGYSIDTGMTWPTYTTALFLSRPTTQYSRTTRCNGLYRKRLLSRTFSYVDGDGRQSSKDGESRDVLWSVDLAGHDNLLSCCSAGRTCRPVLQYDEWIRWCYPTGVTFWRYEFFRPPGTVVPGRPYVLRQFFLSFFHLEISEVRGPISAKFCRTFGSMFTL